MVVMVVIMMVMGVGQAARMKIQFETVQGDNFAFEVLFDFEPSDTVSRSPLMAGMKNVPRIASMHITRSQISPGSVSDG
jgi:hypothetical protein